MSGISASFIIDAKNETDNSFYEAIDGIGDRPKESPSVVWYDLGEEIANGVKYFGQRKVVKGNTTAMCICPKCKELWRVNISNVKTGNTKSCGC